MGLRAPQAPQAPRAPIPEFDVQRKKVEQRINADTQGQQDAMQRRFAANGMLNSGAAIKQQGILANQAQQNREDALAGVDAAEMGEQQRRQEIMDQRDFAATQAQLGRDFEGGQSALNRAFQAGESKLGRDMQADQFGKQFGLSQQQFNAGQDQFNKQFGLSKDQFKAERSDQERNIAASIANLDDDQLAKYNTYLASKGIGTVPDPQAQRMAIYNGRQGSDPFKRKLWGFGSRR